MIFANFFGDETAVYCMLPSKKNGKEHLRAYYVAYPFAFKKKETVFYNLTYKPAVNHILKTLLEHDFDDVKILVDLGLYYIFLLKILLAFIEPY